MLIAIESFVVANERLHPELETQELRLAVYDSGLKLRFVTTGWRGLQQKQEPVKSVATAINRQYPDFGEHARYIASFPNDTKLYPTSNNFELQKILADISNGPERFQGDIYLIREALNAE